MSDENGDSPRRRSMETGEDISLLAPLREGMRIRIKLLPGQTPVGITELLR